MAHSSIPSVDHQFIVSAAFVSYWFWQTMQSEQTAVQHLRQHLQNRSQSLKCNFAVPAGSPRHDGEEGFPSDTRDRFHQHLPPTNTQRHPSVKSKERKWVWKRHTPPADIYMYLPLPEHAPRWKHTPTTASYGGWHTLTGLHRRVLCEHCALVCNSK